MTRREIRDSAFKLIFEKLFRDDSLEELYAVCEEIDEITINAAVKEMAEGVIGHAEELDALISKYSVKRQLQRIPKVSVAILRIAFYEIIYDDKTPVNAAIKEAVLLAEEYASDSDTAFINGVLGVYSREEQEEAVNGDA